MPVLDWTRTDIDYRLPNGASALRFDIVALAAFDLYILERMGAFNDWTNQQQTEAKIYFDNLDTEEITTTHQQHNGRRTRHKRRPYCCRV